MFRTNFLSIIGSLALYTQYTVHTVHTCICHTGDADCLLACICGHDTENVYNDMYAGTRNAILAKHRL